MPDTFRIHGDNIVECERIANIIISETQPTSLNMHLISPSTTVIDLSFKYSGQTYSWHLELLPGFNKSGRRRWDENIFNALKDNGSFLDETPDAIVSSVINGNETILFSIEFCSALQAGNQAWQRSGRAFSTGRTGCPYLYIVDFVKYELDSKTRERKALRFPNPAVPYSYINFSKDSGNFVAQVYVRSEEFDRKKDCLLAHFNEYDFADKELAAYIVKKMAKLSTIEEETCILKKNFNVVMFLAESTNTCSNFTTAQWKRLYTYSEGVLKFSIENSSFSFHKTITAKGHHGKSPKVIELIDSCSVGLASRDLPFGIIPASKRKLFADRLALIYPSYDKNTLAKIGDSKTDLILCIIKGFKPRGDDNRPDRGLLPLATMLSSKDEEIMTYLYGPVIYNNFNLLKTAPNRLANSNGFWKSILALSNYVALDVPILKGVISDAELLLDTTALKAKYTAIPNNPNGLTKKVFSSMPKEYHEDDVDTGIHFLFAHILQSICFEGMCNPPGGDWSGLSIIDGHKEKRWLSLPRVSDEVDGKRPDHVIELFSVFKKPLLLSIESKERSMDLEPAVGRGLINYISHLMKFIPNVEREYTPKIGTWSQSTSKVNFNDFEFISAAAYLKSAAQPNATVFRQSDCDLLFIMQPKQHGWLIEMVPNTKQAAVLKDYLVKTVNATKNSDITII